MNDRGDDVQVWNLGTSSAVLSWFGHSGGTVVAPAVAAPSSDCALPDVVVAARSGTVTRLDAVTGAARWS